MNVAKKKNLQKGEFVVYSPGIHWIKIIEPMLVTAVISLLFFMEVFFGVSSQFPAVVALPLLFSVMFYFLLQIFEGMNRGFFITNKRLIVLIALCPVFLMALVFGEGPWFSYFSGKIIENIKDILLVLLILSGMHFVLQIVEYVNVEYYITNKRLLIKRGIFSDNITDIPIEKIEGLVLVQGFWGAVLNYGTIGISGIGGSRPCFITVWKPGPTRRKIDSVMEKSRAITVIHGKYPEPVEEKPAGREPEDMFKYGTMIKVLPSMIKDE